MSTIAVRERAPEVVEQTTEQKFEYPGIPTTCDGAEAVVHVEIQVAQAAGAYPITSSTTMGGGFNAAVMNGQTNLWGDPLMFFEPESEHSAATVCEGFAVAGGRVTNFTSGQGLVLMKEVLYTISGKRLPVLMNIGARALTSQGLNVHAGHDDVMSVADVGWGMRGKIPRRWYYARVEPALEEAFEVFAQKTGRRYGFVESYRCEDAEYILVGMGSYMETAKVTADYLRKKGVKAGVLTVFVF